jgi:hypothetical protein
MGGWVDRSEQIDEVAAAVVEALGELSDIRKTQTANAGKYAYTYATLADALSMARPVLAGHGLAVTQTAGTEGRDVCIWTTFLHRSGQYVTSAPIRLPVGDTAQATGSAISYGRRYALMAVLGLATEDDDGASAAPRKQMREPRIEARPAAPRSTEETEIRRLIGEASSDEQARVKRLFREHYGMTLAELPESLHESALFQVCEWLEQVDA